MEEDPAFETLSYYWISNHRNPITKTTKIINIILYKLLLG
jgi:hypothetical protein